MIYLLDDHSCAVGFSHSVSTLSKIINIFSEPDEWTATHVYLYLDSCVIVETNIGVGVRRKPAAIYDAKDIKIYRPTFLDDVTRRNMVSLALYVVGEIYGVQKLPLLALDAIFNTYFFSQHVGLTNFKVCSGFIAWLFEKTPTVPVTEQELYEIMKGVLDHPRKLNYRFYDCKWKSTKPNLMQNFCERTLIGWQPIVHNISL